MPKLDLQQVISVADTLLQPLEGTFADASGAPTADCDKRDALRHHSLAVSAFATLTDYILQSQVEPPEEHANRQHSSPFIYELSPEEAVLHEQASQRQKLLVKSCLAALLYAEDSALLAPWSSHQLYLAASSLFVGLCQKVPVHKTNESPVADSGGRMYTQQDFLLWLMPALLPELSAHLKAEDSYNDVHFDATKGPGTFERCLAARQLACLIRQLDYRHLGKAVNLLIPINIAVVQDQAPSVKCYGLHALQFLAKEALSADLKAHQRELTSVARDILVGCEDAVWPMAAPTACAIVCSLGTKGTGAGYVEVVQELLRQAEAQAHKPARSLVWLQAVRPIFSVLGLLTLRFFAKLLPLVLRWCHDDEPAVQLAALQALQEIVRFTWPRMTAHANFLLLEIQGVAAQHGGCSMVSPRRSSQQLAEDTSETHLAIKSCLCNITDMLYLCGGPVLQQQLCNSKQMPGETGRVQGGQVA